MCQSLEMEGEARVPESCDADQVLRGALQKPAWPQTAGAKSKRRGLLVYRIDGLLLKRPSRRFDPQFELMGLGNANTD